MKKTRFETLREFTSFGTTTNLNQDSVISKLKANQRGMVDRRDTCGYALEDSNGGLVRVFVHADQGEEFAQAAAEMQDQAAKNGEPLKIADLLFDLRSRFEIVKTIWGKGTIIPKDEDAEETVDEPVDNDVEGPEGEDNSDITDGAGELPPLDGEEDGKKQSGAENPILADEPLEDIPGPGGMSNDTDALGSLDKMIDMMKADAEARKTEAEARKAEAAVAAGKVASQAASARARAEEEIMDMENYTKRMKEEKRNRDTRSKLLQYRYETGVDPEKKLGENFDHTLAQDEYVTAPMTPEEEELLAMEKWKERKKAEREAKKANELVNNKVIDDKDGDGIPDSQEVKEFWDHDDLRQKVFAAPTEEEELFIAAKKHKEKKDLLRKRKQKRDELLKFKQDTKDKPVERRTFKEFLGDKAPVEDEEHIDLSHRY